MAKKKSEQFEEALSKLQGIIERMERGDLPLEEAVESFTEGVRLVQTCNRKLLEAEEKVRMLLKNEQGNWVASPFDPSSGGSSND